MEIYAHRGYSARYPENTLLAFEQAILSGANGLETDVLLTKDDVCVLHHDEELGRVFEGGGRIDEMTYQELQKYYLNNEFGEFDEKIPRIEDLFSLVKGKNFQLNLELKLDNRSDYKRMIDVLLRTVEQEEMENFIIYSSFHYPAIAYVKERNPQANVNWLLMSKVERLEDYLAPLKLDGLHIWDETWRLYTEKEKKILTEQTTVRLWTVNEVSEVEAYKMQGVSGIITDIPLEMKSVSENESFVIK